MENYTLDPIQIIGRGLATYDAAADAHLRKGTYLSKLPGVHVSEPALQQVRLAQSEGAFWFESPVLRQQASCTRPQLDIMPDRISTEYYPLKASVATAIEPFQRQGTDSRNMVKDQGCISKNRWA